MLAVVALSWPCVASADSFGDARQLSRVGEPLRLSIPVRADGGPPVQERCLGVVAPAQSDGLPHIMTARVALETAGSGPAIVVTTAAPLREPVIRLVVRTGCDGTTRAYTLFLEPASSTRQVRAVAQPGPRVPLPAAVAEPSAARSDAPAAPPPVVTTIPVSPAGRSMAAPALTPRAAPPVRAPAVERSAVERSAVERAAIERPGVERRPLAERPLVGERPPLAGGSPGAERPAVAGASDRGALPSAGSGTRADPGGAGATRASEGPATGASRPAADTIVAAATPAATPDTRPTPPSAGGESASATTDPTRLEAENINLKQQLAILSGELERLQSVPPPSPAVSEATSDTRAPALAAGWEVAWPVIVALVGLAAVVLGGFMWRRRLTPDEWALTGPPSHRMASRTSLAEEPVPFKQAGVRVDAPSAEAAPEPLPLPAAPARPGTAPPAVLLLQPSAEDLSRDLEQELFIAEHAHSALERAHPEIVDALTGSWGTAAARHQLTTLLNPASGELARMSGEAVAELRLLLRIAEELSARTANGGMSAAGYGPPAPAW